MIWGTPQISALRIDLSRAFTGIVGPWITANRKLTATLSVEGMAAFGENPPVRLLLSNVSWREWLCENGANQFMVFASEREAAMGRFVEGEDRAQQVLLPPSLEDYVG
ncbi:MAG: hypothetical protein RJS97_23080, partial [Parvibaculaceae bacterium]